MEEKEKGRGRSAREKDGTGKEGGLRVTARRPRALFIPSSRAREACEHKGCFRGKKQFQYLAQKNFFFPPPEYRFLNMYWERVEWE